MSDVMFTAHTAPEHTCSLTVTHTHTLCAAASNVILKPIRVFVWDPEELPPTPSHFSNPIAVRWSVNAARTCAYYVNIQQDYICDFSSFSTLSTATNIMPFSTQ